MGFMQRNLLLLSFAGSLPVLAIDAVLKYPSPQSEKRGAREARHLHGGWTSVAIATVTGKVEEKMVAGKAMWRGLKRLTKAGWQVERRPAKRHFLVLIRFSHVRRHPRECQKKRCPSQKKKKKKFSRQ